MLSGRKVCTNLQDFSYYSFDGGLYPFNASPKLRLMQHRTGPIINFDIFIKKEDSCSPNCLIEVEVRNGSERKKERKEKEREKERKRKRERKKEGERKKEKGRDRERERKNELERCQWGFAQ